MQLSSVARRIGNRVKVLADYAAPRDFSVPLLSIVHRVVATPSTTRGPNLIHSVSADGDDLRVSLKGVSRPLYWPSVLPLAELYAVLSECFYDDDWHFYEVPETRVESGDVVVDCGAAEGAFALKVHERARLVAAFEPLPLFQRAMHRTFADSGTVQVIPHALSRAEGTAFLDDAGICATITSDPTKNVVQVTTIDAWAARSNVRVDFIKADVEDYELDVLIGAAETLRRDKPKLAITTYHMGNDWSEMVRFVKNVAPGYQYRVKGIIRREDGRVRPVMLHAWHP